MATFINWIKKKFNFLFFGKIHDELVGKISNTDNVSAEVKQDLISSILHNDPKKFVEQLNGGKVPEEMKNDLMNRLERASMMYCNPIERDALRNPHDVIYVSKIIPSDQFVVHSKPIVKKQIICKTPKVSLLRAHRRMMAQLKFKLFVRECKKQLKINKTLLKPIHTGKIIPSGQFRYGDMINKHEGKVIHTGKIIPSDQFVVHSNPIRYVPMEQPMEINWEAMFNRVVNQMKTRFFINVRREEIRMKNEPIHTGKIIPSDQFVPYSKLSRKVITLRQFPERDWEKAYERVLEQLKFKFFIKNQINRKALEIQNLRIDRCKWRRVYDNVLGHLHLIQFIRNCSKTNDTRDKGWMKVYNEVVQQLNYRVEPLRVIHTGKIIPSGQFNPVSNPIKRNPVLPKCIYPMTRWQKSLFEFNRMNIVFHKMKLRRVIFGGRRAKQLKKEIQQVDIPIIPSGQFKPISNPVRINPVLPRCIYPETLEMYFRKLVFEERMKENRRNLHQFLEVRRIEMRWLPKNLLD